MENVKTVGASGSPPPSRLPGMATRAQRKKLPIKQRVAILEEFVAALLPLVLHLADQLEETTGRPYLRDVFPNREKFSARAAVKPQTKAGVSIGAGATKLASPEEPAKPEGV